MLAVNFADKFDDHSPSSMASPGNTYGTSHMCDAPPTSNDSTVASYSLEAYESEDLMDDEEFSERRPRRRFVKPGMTTYERCFSRTTNLRANRARPRSSTGLHSVPAIYNSSTPDTTTCEGRKLTSLSSVLEEVGKSASVKNPKTNPQLRWSELRRSSPSLETSRTDLDDEEFLREAGREGLFIHRSNKSQRSQRFSVRHSLHSHENDKHEKKSKLLQLKNKIKNKKFRHESPTIDAEDEAAFTAVLGSGNNYSTDDTKQEDPVTLVGEDGSVDGLPRRDSSVPVHPCNVPEKRHSDEEDVEVEHLMNSSFLNVKDVDFHPRERQNSATENGQVIVSSENSANVTEFLGGYKSHMSQRRGGSSRPRSIRSRKPSISNPATSELTKRLREARARIPVEFRDEVYVSTEKKTKGKKHIRFDPTRYCLEFEVESEEEDEMDVSADESDASGEEDSSGRSV